MITFYRDAQRSLRAPEIDENFSDLDRRLRAIESLGLQAVAFDSVTWDSASGTILFTYSDRRTYGPVSLPQSFFVARGPWMSGLAYQYRDLVSVAGSLYVCRGDH